MIPVPDSLNFLDDNQKALLSRCMAYHAQGIEGAGFPGHHLITLCATLYSAWEELLKAMVLVSLQRDFMAEEMADTFNTLYEGGEWSPQKVIEFVLIKNGLSDGPETLVDPIDRIGAETGEILPNV